MTREEAIRWLESLKREIGKAENRTLWHYAESIDMAMEALKGADGDLISRQDAIDAICKEWCYVTYGNCPHSDDGFACDGCDDVKAIQALPSAEPKTGEWVRKDDGLFFWYECSECGNKPMANRFSYREERSAFCPHCGAKMYKDGEDE